MQYQRQLQVKLQQALEVIAGVVTPDIKYSGHPSALSTPAEHEKQANIPRGMMGGSMKRGGNELFMNFATKQNDIEFPGASALFPPGSPKSQRTSARGAGGIQGLRKMKTRGQHEKRHHHRHQRSIGMLGGGAGSTNPNNDFDVIEEESPKMVAMQDEQEDSSRKQYNSRQRYNNAEIARSMSQPIG